MDGRSFSTTQKMETVIVNFQEIIVSKPWGQEYLVYENEQVALWLLYIKKNGVQQFLYLK